MSEKIDLVGCCDGKKVLVADEDSIYRGSISSLFYLHGWTYFLARNGVEGLRVGLEKTIDYFKRLMASP